MADKNEELLMQSFKSTSIASSPIPHSSSLPTTLTRSYTIDLIETDIWVQLFNDRCVIGVSQLENGRVGNYLLCQPEPSPIDPKAIDFHIDNLLGVREDPLLSVYLRQITETIVGSQAARGSKPYPAIILGISLHKTKAKDPDMFRILVDLIVKLHQDAKQISSGNWDPEIAD
jgi:hypothetical protein